MNRFSKFLLKKSVFFAILMTATFSSAFAEKLVTGCSPELSSSELTSAFREPKKLDTNINQVLNRAASERACGENGESRNGLYSKKDVQAWAKQSGAQKIFTSPAELNAVIDEVVFMGSRAVGEMQALPAFQAAVLTQKGKGAKVSRSEFLKKVNGLILGRLPDSERENFVASLQGKKCP